MSVSIGFDVKPLDAINYFKSKGLKTTFSYADMVAADHVNNLTIAKMMDMDLLQDMYDSLLQAQKKGWTLEQWKDRMIPHLQANGWWGRQAVVDPISGKTIVAELGSSRRLDVIFRTNMQMSYAAGQWQQIEANKKIMPYLLYNAVDDFRTRDEHRALDNKVYPVDHYFWFTHYPPNSWNCRCSVIQLSQKNLAEYGLEVSPDAEIEYKNWKNPRTGLIEKIPKGTDAGFNFNAGMARQQTLQRIAQEKVQAIKNKELREAAEEALVKIEQEVNLSNAANKMNKKDSFNQPPTETFSIYDAGALPVKPDVSTPLKKAVVDLEDTIRKDDMETGAAFNDKGELLFKRQGLPDRLDLTDDELKLLNNATFTHNHPMGMPFSIADIRMAISHNIKEIRAVTPLLRYSMSPKKQWAAKITLIATINEVKAQANIIVNEKIKLGEINPQFAEAEYLHYIWLMVADRLELNYGRERS